MRRNEDVEFDFPKTPIWDAVRQELIERDILIFELQAFETGSRVNLTGAIGSVKESTILEEVVKRLFPRLKVFNKVIVTAPFSSPDQSHFDIWPDDVDEAHG